MTVSPISIRKTLPKGGIRLILILILGAPFMLPPPALSAPKTIQACGMAQVMDDNLGRAKTQSLADAQRNAVEMGLGTLIDSTTIVNNAVLLKDRIYSRASGYVTDYKVTTEGLTPSQKAYETCIEATVDTADIKADLRAIGILKQRVGNPRFMVVYLPDAARAAKANSPVVKAAEQVIRDAFLKKGFIVLERDFVKDFNREMTKANVARGDLPGMSRLAQAYQADLLLLFDVNAADRSELSNPYFKEVMLSLNIRSVSPDTAELISAKGRSSGVRTSKSMGGNYYESPLFAESMGQLAQLVVEESLADTLAHFERQTTEGALFTCRFKGFQPDEIMTIVNVVENMGGYRDKNVRRQSLDLVLVDINYLGKRFDFQRELLSGMENKGLAATIAAMQGNDFTILKSE